VYLELTLRLLAALLAGALLGVEREVRGHVAGVRTHGLVAVGAALFTIVGAYGFPELARSSNVDPQRVAAQVVTGIGFIGAGVIMRDGFSVKGITTAATLWIAGALGVTAGAGAWFPLLAGALVIAGCLLGLRVLKNYLERRWRRGRATVTVAYAKGSGTIAPILAALESAGLDLTRLSIDDDDEPDGTRRAILDLRGRSERFDGLVDRLRETPTVTEVTIG
jgi:putative Mg2+ transporter-C (MgtC) family protein